MDVEAVLDRMMEVGVTVWLDDEGKLRIDKGAPDEIKQIVREHKQELIGVRRAQEFMHRAGIRIIRLPLGHLALAYPPHTNLYELRWAANVLRMDSMPLVINDEEPEWISPQEWRRRQAARIFADHRRKQLRLAATEAEPPTVRGRRA